MKIFIFVIILPLYSMAIFAQSPDKAYLYTKKTADSFLTVGNFKQAANLYKLLVTDKNANPRDFYRAAYCFHYLNQTKEAIAYLNKALDMGILYPKESMLDADAFINQNIAYLKEFKKKFRTQTLENIKVGNKALFDTLMVRKTEDQQYRQMDKSGFSDLAKDSILQLQMAIDAANQQWLLAFVTQHGWPGYKQVGYAGDEAAWLIVQHADKNVPLQQLFLRLIQKAIASNNSSAQNFAYLVDRILVNTNSKQIYGTQFDMQRTDKEIIITPKPVEDAFLLNTLRDYVGLPSIEEYITSSTKRMKEKYGIGN